MPESEDDLVKKVSEVLTGKGIKYAKNMIVGDSNPDILFQSPTGHVFIIEVKNWKPTIRNQKRAHNLARLYANTSGSAGAYVVLPGDFDSDIDDGVISAQELSTAVDQIIEQTQYSSYTEPPYIRKRPERFIFAAMPFKPEYDDTYLVAVQPAALEAGFGAKRVDYEPFTGEIIRKIKQLITQSDAVIADVSESLPNVLYELGYGDALGKTTIQICSTSLNKLPFDIRNDKTIPYKKGQTSKLKAELAKQFKALVS